MRGKGSLLPLGTTTDRITPAYAGKSFWNEYYHQLVKDHPRLCGEKKRTGTLLKQFSGSPPPMRGKADCSGYTQTYNGITPAYAGKSTCRKTNRQHLHGSPPPMRGKGVSSASPATPVRITPAYAGKSFAKSVNLLQAQDHPRLCGEKYIQYHHISILPGSPPPMRGKVSTDIQTSGFRRITPAYAGKRYHHQKDKKSEQDHPRLCGEKAPGMVSRGRLLGSPPPMRGKDTRLL